MTQLLLSWIIPLSLFALIAPYMLQRFNEKTVITLALLIWAMGAILVSGTLGVDFHDPFTSSKEMLVYWITWLSVFGIALLGTTRWVTNTVSIFRFN